MTATSTSNTMRPLPSFIIHQRPRTLLLFEPTPELCTSNFAGHVYGTSMMTAGVGSTDADFAGFGPHHERRTGTDDPPLGAPHSTACGRTDLWNPSSVEAPFSRTERVSNGTVGPTHQGHRVAWISACSLLIQTDNSPTLGCGSDFEAEANAVQLWSSRSTTPRQ